MKCIISTSGSLVIKRMSLAALVTYDKKPETLAGIVNHFLQNDKQAKQANVSAEEADAVFPSLPKRVRAVLQHEGFEAKLIRCFGFKKKVNSTAADRVQEVPPGHIDHAVVIVNQISIDPCRSRMGDVYEVPPTYNKSELDKFWFDQKDVTTLAALAPEGARELLQRHGDAERKAGLEKEAALRKGR